jgi:hypothetical protein
MRTDEGKRAGDAATVDGPDDGINCGVTKLDEFAVVLPVVVVVAVAAVVKRTGIKAMVPSGFTCCINSWCCCCCGCCCGCGLGCMSDGDAAEYEGRGDEDTL